MAVPKTILKSALFAKYGDIALKKIVLLAFAMFVLPVSSPLFIEQALAACGDDPEQGVNWEGCRKRNLMLSGNDLKKANFKGTNFSSTDMRKSEFDDADFRKSVLLRVFFDGSSAKNANFEKAIVYRVNFKKTDLTNAIFQKSEMLRVNFSGANLTEANFSKSQAGRSIFTGAILGNNDFSYASMARADFRGAKISGPLEFSGTFFFQIRIEGVDLSQATGLKQWQIDMACGDDATILPQDVNRPESWACDDE
ncbi:MAG: pentapeptide repeat-containing protein [Hyphomicrobiales bacterium]|nr:pentapeptide repeat-containing protein [Hyphomicrobiales bacterium]